MILLVDNHDSFVHTLARYVRELGEDACVRRGTALTIDDVHALAPTHIILSPGPCSPAEAPIAVDIVRRFGPVTPTLGVCLGHQCIAAAYGARVVQALRPVHGRSSRIRHDATGILSGIPSPFDAARYHSLVVDPTSVPPDLRACAWADDDGTLMAIAHRVHPVTGLQFHPESAMTEWGYHLLDAFLHGRCDRHLPRTADTLDPSMAGAHGASGIAHG